MIIGTCGFSWSGSSAVADFLAEFDENQVYNEDEFILAFFPDGIEDLDFNLNTKCSKFLSSTVAIPRFRKVVKLLLEKATDGKIDELTDDYLKELVQVKWIGTGQGQVLFHSPYFYKLSSRIIRHLPEKFSKKYIIPPLTKMEYAIKPDNFDIKTQYYIDCILGCIGLDLNKNIVLDQPFPGNNPVRCMKYFRDSRAIIVDRDPRDLYMLAKEYFPRRTFANPHDDVEDFITFFYHMHKDMKNVANQKDILYLRFEDLVFEYEKTTKKIIDFLNLGEHVRPRKHFQPERSMANTRLFEKCKKYPDDIKRIEEKLSDFLFDFDKYSDRKAEGGMFDENPPIEWRKDKK